MKILMVTADEALPESEVGRDARSSSEADRADVVIAKFSDGSLRVVKDRWSPFPRELTPVEAFDLGRCADRD